MSFFVFTDRSDNKRVLTQKEHQSVIRKLKRPNQLKTTIRALQTHLLDKSLEETETILDLLQSHSDSTKFGRIVEWTIRQIVNRDLPTKVQPTVYPTKPVELDNKVRRPFPKAQSLGLDFMHFQIKCKIEDDPEAYNQEMEKEELSELVNSYKETAFDRPSCTADAPDSTLMDSIEHKYNVSCNDFVILRD